MKEFFNYYMTDSVLDANEIYRNPGILIFNVLQENLHPSFQSLIVSEPLMTGLGSQLEASVEVSELQEGLPTRNQKVIQDGDDAVKAKYAV